MSNDSAGRGDHNGDRRPVRAPDLVERLVRLADAGPATPTDGVERVRAAIRPAWRAEVEARRRRRHLLWAGGGLAAAASLLIALSLVTRSGLPAQPSARPVATLAAVVGSFELLAPVGAPVEVSSVERGREVLAGSWLRTGPEARAALALIGGQSLRVDVESRVRLVSATAIELDRGAVYVDSGGAERAGVEVRTSLGVARDIGTQFEVRRIQGTLTVRVREGKVSLAHADEQLQVTSGTELTIAANGPLQTRRSLPSGPEWGWAQAVAPPFEIEGRSAVAFLDWVSRETGLWVSFASPEVESLAAATTLHGSIAGLEPAEAVTVVLPGCGLSHRVRDGTLVVEQP